eukprot:gene21134-27386_t
MAPLVLVTGVSGYIASWVAHLALKLGYRVRGTVRSLDNEFKIKHLRNLCIGSKNSIELVEADLTSDKGWDEAVADCDYILHLASPFPFEHPKDKQEIIKPAVEGTLRVLTAASRQLNPPKRIVITSSYVSIAYGCDIKGKIFTDETWTIVDDPKYPIAPYVESKTLAEKAAWKFVEDLPADKKLEIAFINPSLVFGPMISNSDCTSADTVKSLIIKKIPAVPDIEFDLIHVFDVAKAHILAMTTPNAVYKRFLLVGVQINYRNMAAILYEEFKPQGYNPAYYSLPTWLLRLAALFNPEAKAVLKYIGPRRNFNPKNVKDILGLTVNTNGEELVKSMAYAAINSGIIKDKSPNQSITKNYIQPEIDISDLKSV